MTTEMTELRYVDLKNSICHQIYKGAYSDGEKIPSERQLALDYNVSRITVRRALELLEEDDLIKREVGSGTQVQLRNWGNVTSLDVVALVAPSKNPFFVDFIAEFQKTAWEHDTLLLYVEVPIGTGLEDCLYQLYSKNIRNAVVWPDDQQVDTGRLLRLRSIGMNLVFFDTDDAYPYADCVFLDNEDAVKTLIERQENVHGRYLYIGWDNLAIKNVKKREEAFKKICPDSPVLELPWKRNRDVDEADIRRIRRAIEAMGEGLVICNTGETGHLAAQIISGMSTAQDVNLAVVDDFEEAKNYPMAVYGQDLSGTAERIYMQLEAQIKKNKSWKAKNWAIKGNYIIYKGGQNGKSKSGISAAENIK